MSRYTITKLEGEGPAMEDFHCDAESFADAAQSAAWHFDHRVGGTWFTFKFRVVDDGTGEAKVFEADPDESKEWSVVEEGSPNF